MSNLKWRNLIVLFLVMGIFNSCQTPSGTKALKKGLWRGTFLIPNVEIPFQFEVEGDNPERTILYLINGEDRFEINNVKYYGDSVTITVDLYDVVLKAKITEESLNGHLIRLGTGSSRPAVPFSAEYGDLPRFPQSSNAPSVLLAGTWDIEIGTGQDVNKTVGIFDQKESFLTGSILTTTGDYRFLEGVVDANKFSLSSFGGSTPYLVQGEFTNDNTFTGKFVTPYRSVEIAGKRNSQATLPDAYSVTYLKDGYSSLGFSFPNLDGNQVSLSDPRYAGKVVIVSILGSWCPNCLDESAFLSDWYKKKRHRGVEIIGLGFERKNDFEHGKKMLTTLKDRLDIQYELLFAGELSKENRSKALPELNKIASFPTTLFIDKKGNVRKIHSGFSGPATGKFYDEYLTEFNGLIDELLAEE